MPSLSMYPMESPEVRRQQKQERRDAINLWKFMHLKGSLSKIQRIARNTKDIQNLPVSNLSQNSRDYVKAFFAEVSPTSIPPTPVGFAGPLTIQSRVHGRILAYVEHKRQNYSPDHVIFWVDGSASNEQGSCSAAVAWRKSKNSGWSANGYHIPQNLGADTAELVAIIKALELTEQNVVRSAVSPRTLTIYSDAKFVLQDIMKYEVHPAELEGCDLKDIDLFDLLIGKAITLSQRLKLRGIHIQLHWVPAHSRGPGHDLADRVAKRANAWNGLA